MMSIDPVIARMNEEHCLNCKCINAVFDDTSRPVTIVGSFCTPVPGHTMISITAWDSETNNEVWHKDCETGITCNIPFTSTEDFDCY